MQSSNYYQPNPQQYMMQPPIVDDSIAVGGGGEEDDSDGSGIPDKRSGRRKIKIEYINDKSRRHITFSKRKAGIMKKAYELSTLTGTQVLLLVVSETGLVYTFTTPKLQPLVTKPEGKNLIQSCLNAPDPIESSTSSSLDHHHQSQQQSQQQNSRSIMSTNAPTSPSTTNNNNYYRSNQNIDSINNSSNSYGDDRRVFKQEDANKGGYGGGMAVPNPSLVLNNTTTDQQQLTSNYSLPYTYNTTGSATASNTSNTANANAVGASLYSYNLPTQQDNNDRYWNGASQVNNNTRQRQDKR